MRAVLRLDGRSSGGGLGRLILHSWGYEDRARWEIKHAQLEQC